MAYFPFFMEIGGVSGLIVGGGAVAFRKVKKMLPYRPDLTVVALEFCPELLAIPEITRRHRAFQEDDLHGVSFVIAATDEPSLNHRIFELCRKRGLPVNVVDDQADCSFLFPALVQCGNLSIGISTGGSSPTAAIYLKKKISALMPENFDEILDWLNALRPMVKTLNLEEQGRAQLFALLFEQCRECGRPLNDRELRETISSITKKGAIYNE